MAGAPEVIKKKPAYVLTALQNQKNTSIEELKADVSTNVDNDVYHKDENHQRSNSLYRIDLNDLPGSTDRYSPG